MKSQDMPSIDTLHDYDRELHVAYGRRKEVAPQITSPQTAYKLGHELMERLSDVDDQYELNLSSSETADDPIAAKQEDMMQREEAIKKAMNTLEFKHRKEAPIDFINGERHYDTVAIDPAMRQRMKEHTDVVTERSLGAQIDAMGLDTIDPNHGTGLTRKPPETDQP